MSTSKSAAMPYFAAVLRSYATTLALIREETVYRAHGVEPPDEFRARVADTKMLTGSIGVALQAERARAAIQRPGREGY